MTDGREVATAVGHLVVARRPWSRQPLAWFALGPADRALVDPEHRVQPGDALLERLEAGRPSGSEQVASAVSGAVEALGPAGIGIRCDGIGLTGAVFAGESVRGPLFVAVGRRHSELRAGAIDVGAAGAILVAGARVESDALTRARAIGVRGVVTGGIGGRDLRAFLASEARQQAGLHPAVPFGLLVLDGYGRRPIARPIWTWLTAQQGQDVALLQDPPMLAAEAFSPVESVPFDHVRVVGGPALGREGRLLEAVGPWRAGGGLYQPSARVELEPEPPDLPAETRLLPLADLERFE